MRGSRMKRLHVKPTTHASSSRSSTSGFIVISTCVARGLQLYSGSSAAGAAGCATAVTGTARASNTASRRMHGAHSKCEANADASISAREAVRAPALRANEAGPAAARRAKTARALAPRALPMGLSWIDAHTVDAQRVLFAARTAPPSRVPLEMRECGHVDARRVAVDAHAVALAGLELRAHE